MSDISATHFIPAYENIPKPFISKVDGSHCSCTAHFINDTKMGIGLV